MRASGLSPLITDFLAGLALLLFGVALSRMNKVLKRTQHRQIADLWKERERLQDDTDRLLEPRPKRHLRRISGGSAVEPARGPETLRPHVRLWLAKGLLPAPGDSWAGPGTGKLCSVCARVISPTDIEYAIGHGAGRLYAHQPCHAIWAEEAATARQHDAV